MACVVRDHRKATFGPCTFTPAKKRQFGTGAHNSGRKARKNIADLGLIISTVIASKRAHLAVLRASNSAPFTPVAFSANHRDAEPEQIDRPDQIACGIKRW